VSVTDFAPDAVSSFFALRQHYADVASRLGVTTTAKRHNPPMREQDLRSLLDGKELPALPPPDLPLPEPRVDTGEWRPIPGVPQYMVSDLGQIRHVDSRRIRKPRPSYRGYALMSYRINGAYTCESVHTMVAEAFLGPKPRGAFCCFLDGDKTNIRASNLAYMTASQAQRHKRALGKCATGLRNGGAYIPDSTVLKIRALAASGAASQRELAKRFRVSQAQISNIVLFKQRAVHGMD
jgi:hypothetical protein